MTPTIISCLGKGGVGKTATSTLIGKYYIENGFYPLFVDADPVLGLQKTLGIETAKSIAEARSELIQFAKSKNMDNYEETEEAIEFIVMNVLQQHEKYGFISMGQNTNPGCFCAVNNLLRSTLKSEISKYNPIIIDAEAGVEQVNRMVVENINYALLITDISKRGVDTCLTIKDTIDRIKSMSNCKTGVVFNKTDHIPELHSNYLKEMGLKAIGKIPSDNELIECDMKGDSLIDISNDNLAYKSIENIIKGFINS